MTASASGTSVFLAPPSPPSSPHLGTVYTWCLLDAAARASRHLGTPAVLPESWNLASRRLDQQLREDRAAGREQDPGITAAIGSARSTLARYGIATDAWPPVRDDDPGMRRSIITAATRLAEENKISYVTVPEKWCDPCGIAVPATSAIQECFRCGLPVAIHERSDWFLTLDFPSILAAAERSQWLPPYALARFRNLTGMAPHVRVGHYNRLVGVPSPFDDRQMLDPRLVCALYPGVLRHMGFSRIVTAAGQDIQRKWLTLVFAAATPTTAPALDTIINHGMLLADSHRKMSRYSGATIGDLPETAEPGAYRAALVSASLGRDIVASTVGAADASRLRAKVHNSIRFLAAQQPADSPPAVDVADELGPALEQVETHLANLDLQRAYATYRTVIRADLSQHLIPQIRARGCGPVLPTIRRIQAIASVFFGREARCD